MSVGQKLIILAQGQILVKKVNVKVKPIIKLHRSTAHVKGLCLSIPTST